MATINLSTDQVLELAEKLEKWAQQLESTNDKTLRVAESIASWTDEQHRLFLDNLRDTRKEICLCTEKLHNIARILKCYAEITEDNRLNFVEKIL